MRIFLRILFIIIGVVLEIGIALSPIWFAITYSNIWLLFLFLVSPIPAKIIGGGVVGIGVVMLE